MDQKLGAVIMPGTHPGCAEGGPQSAGPLTRDLPIVAKEGPWSPWSRSGESGTPTDRGVEMAGATRGTEVTCCGYTTDHLEPGLSQKHFGSDLSQGG